MNSDLPSRELLPEAVVLVLEEFRRAFKLDLSLWLMRTEGGPRQLFPPGRQGGKPDEASILLQISTREGIDLILEARGGDATLAGPAANALRTSLEQLYAFAEEVRFFTFEVSERYEEINLLYSIAETLGSVLHLNEASRLILADVCEVMGARRGSLWAHDPEVNLLNLVASVGDGGLEGPLRIDDTTAVTSQVFRDGHPLILTGEGLASSRSGNQGAPSREDSVLSVPIRYTPPNGTARTVGVINLIGRSRGGPFTSSDQRLLSAIASQVGSALENTRLIRESLAQERVSREMELAHDLQMKLLPSADALDPERGAARLESAESVGGDFYNFFSLPGGRFGVMIGDVSSHGFPAALIMALSMSAGAIYATELGAPARVLSEMDEALREELASTEMYLTLFYGVVDPAAGEFTYANAGHPHAFVVREGGETERLEAMDLPMGIAEGGEYHQRTVPLSSGRDLLFLFTDGLSDPLIPTSRNRAEALVLDEIVARRAEPAADIVNALFALESGEDGVENVGDDRTAVVLRI